MADTRRLPHPVTSEWTWQIEGTCRGMDSAVFFHPDGERGGARLRRQRAAKAVCDACPVLVMCRTHALNAREPYGVWGGLSEEERQSVISKGDLAVHAAISAVVERQAAARALPSPARSYDDRRTFHPASG